MKALNLIMLIALSLLTSGCGRALSANSTKSQTSNPDTFGSGTSDPSANSQQSANGGSDSGGSTVRGSTGASSSSGSSTGYGGGVGADFHCTPSPQAAAPQFPVRTYAAVNLFQIQHDYLKRGYLCQYQYSDPDRSTDPNNLSNYTNGLHRGASTYFALLGGVTLRDTVVVDFNDQFDSLFTTILLVGQNGHTYSLRWECKKSTGAVTWNLFDLYTGVAPVVATGVTNGYWYFTTVQPPFQAPWALENYIIYINDAAGNGGHYYHWDRLGGWSFH